MGANNVGSGGLVVVETNICNSTSRSLEEGVGGYTMLAEGWWGASCGILLSLQYIRIIKGRGVMH